MPNLPKISIGCENFVPEVLEVQSFQEVFGVILKTVISFHGKISQIYQKCLA